MSCRAGGMVDAAVLKTAGCKLIWVRVPGPAGMVLTAFDSTRHMAALGNV